MKAIESLSIPESQEFALNPNRMNEIDGGVRDAWGARLV